MSNKTLEINEMTKEYTESSVGYDEIGKYEYDRSRELARTTGLSASTINRIVRQEIKEIFGV